MEKQNINLKELWKAYIEGADPTLLANNNNISVSALFKRFKDEGYIVENKKKIDWLHYYKKYMNEEVTVLQLVKDLDVTSTTVYNNFAKFGYNRQTRTNVNETKLYEDYLNGSDVGELARIYNRSPTYIRFIIRRKKQELANQVVSDGI